MTLDQNPEETRKFLETFKQELENIERAVSELNSAETDAKVIIHPEAETVEESAENTGMSEDRIVKTLVFIAEAPVAVMCPGDTTVSEQKLEALRDGEVRMAQPQEVKEHTGYRIGGVSPFDLEIDILMEESLLEKESVKPAAGSPVTGVSVSPEDLRKISGAEPVDVSRK